MKNYLTKTEADELCKTTEVKDSYNVGELYPHIFSSDDELEFKDGMPLDVAIIWLGTFEINSSIFPKMKCPICGKTELIPYFCGASILSGCHVIKFYCLNCNEKIAFNRVSDYYHEIRNYILKNRQNLKKSEKCNATTVFD